MGVKTTAVFGIAFGVLLIAIGIDLLRTPNASDEEPAA